MDAGHDVGVELGHTRIDLLRRDPIGFLARSGERGRWFHEQSKNAADEDSNIGTLEAELESELPMPSLQFCECRSCSWTKAKVRSVSGMTAIPSRFNTLWKDSNARSALTRSVVSTILFRATPLLIITSF